MRRAVPLWRSDYAYEPIGHQCMTYGISLWLPYHGTGTVASAAAPYYGGGTDPGRAVCVLEQRGPQPRQRDRPRACARSTTTRCAASTSQWRKLSEFYYGDYYPLTPYTQDNGAWIAWQFDCPERGEGAVQAFRRAQCPTETARFKLRGLEPDARYTLTNLDDSAPIQMTGRTLAESGLPVTLKAKPAAAVIVYKK